MPDVDHESDREAAAPAISLRELPLFEDVFLNMQAMNVEVVDGHLRQMEAAFATEWNEDERLPMPTAMLVSAVSQMWVFAAYELLRTWREWARSLIDHAGRMEKAATPESRADIQAKLRRRVSRQPSASLYEASIERAERDPQFIQTLAEAEAQIAPTFEMIELVRITLAKHEIPKGRSVRAAAPGYARFDRISGGAMWFVDTADGGRWLVQRLELAAALGFGE